jgi:hypothetical protein
MHEPGMVPGPRRLSKCKHYVRVLEAQISIGGGETIRPTDALARPTPAVC